MWGLKIEMSDAAQAAKAALVEPLMTQTAF